MIVLTCIIISIFFVGKLRHKALSKIFKVILLIIGVDLNTCKGFPGGSDGKESTCNEGDLGSISGSGRSPGEGDGNPLKYSCLENSVDTGAWLAMQSMGSRRVGYNLATNSYLLSLCPEPCY